MRNPDPEPAPEQITARQARHRLEEFTHVTLELTPEQARAIACVRRPDVALDECDPADEDECREHLEGVIEGIVEEVSAESD